MFRMFVVTLAISGYLVGAAQPAVVISKSASFRSDAKLVLVPVTVVDRRGALVAAVPREAFTILEDKVSQPIVSFTNEDAPCSVGLVVDTSGSMRYSLRAAKDMAHAFFATTNANDEFLLLTVSTQPETISRFTNDTAALEEQIQFTKPAGMTALVDTVYLGLNKMHRAKQPRRALLVISDGMENYSRYSKSELMQVALEADVQIYAIITDGIASGSSGPAPFRPSLAAKPIDQARERQEPHVLEELSEKTGGLHFRVRNDSEAKEAVLKIGQVLRNQYVIGYVPQNSDRSGKWHSIEVRVNRHDVKVYSRSGYRSYE